jgi:hypothetical protein
MALSPACSATFDSMIFDHSFWPIFPSPSAWQKPIAEKRKKTAAMMPTTIKPFDFIRSSFNGFKSLLLNTCKDEMPFMEHASADLQAE